MANEPDSQLGNTVSESTIQHTNESNLTQQLYLDIIVDNHNTLSFNENDMIVRPISTGISSLDRRRESRRRRRQRRRQRIREQRWEQQRQLEERRRVSQYRQQRYQLDRFRQERHQRQTYRTSYDRYRTDPEDNEYHQYIHSLWTDYDEGWEEEVQERLLDQYNAGLFNTREQWEQHIVYEFENLQHSQQSPTNAPQLQAFFRRPES